MDHEGFLHLAAATEGEYAFSTLPDAMGRGGGGWFTVSLIDTIYQYPDSNGDNFVSWKEIFEVTKKKTMERFDLAYPNFSIEWKADLRRRGITSQTPKYYSLPTRLR